MRLGRLTSALCSLELFATLTAEEVSVHFLFLVKNFRFPIMLNCKVVTFGE